MLNKNSTQAKHKKPSNPHHREFEKLLRYIHRLANHKLGYPVSLLTYLGIIDNQILGINPHTLANVLLNNVGDPFVDSQTSLMEVKKHERMLIHILEKYFGLNKNEARGYVTTGGTEGNFASLWWSKRYLINCALDKLIETDDQIKVMAKQEQELMAALAKISINAYQERASHLQKIIDVKNDLHERKEIMQQLLTPTVFYSKDATHYSIPKISEILRLNIHTVATNKDGSMNLSSLKKELILHQGSHPHSSLIVIANIGTTITGAIDDVPNIKKILDEIKPKPTFTMHMDGALTGFVLPIIKPFGDIPNYFDAIGVNTLVFSAHKYPGLSQPCGIILARRAFFDKAFEKSERAIDYVGNIRDVTITGSRSGLNVLMFYNALHTLDLENNNMKLKTMLNENIENAKYLHKKLAEIYGEEHVYYPNQFNIMFPKPSMQIAKKYQLMITGEIATICVLTNVSKNLIHRFISDLKIDRRKTMKPNEIKNTIKIEDLTEKHLKPAVDLFVKSFCDSEPITKYLGITHAEYTPFATDVTKKAIKDGLGKVVLNEKNQLIGLILGDDLADPFTPELSRYPKMKPIYALLEELSKPFLDGKKFKKGKVLHTWIAAIDEKYRSHGIYIEMGMAHVESAIKNGFDFIYSDFTNTQSEAIVRQFKILRLCNKLKLADYIFQSNKPFEGVSGEVASYITPIKPGITLESLTDCYTLTEKMKQRS